ncbi:mycofactocin-coupled SDR family oxidoreductase [Nocardioides carbamazepini]|jgi:SDR family mycofactocin-dependent oxidoreductase|uniref:mycofactocin-coupled SDR family oxidoreductase n=1 Tax=Nocardioides carbamazepini TaxID=2854259 RepID=UPI002149B67C|nr:mycofactocin-coupled SDR family oxidoreductase [Nocardioides carbamazepini]MCR1784314.1 mycofactocin-coupled SDR family oxidoreductase [Nocardioides carbamazepini]
MNSSFEGKVAFITGGARGQGREAALEFARRGADVVVVDIAADIASVPYPLASKEDLEQTRALVEAEGRACLALVADVRDQSALDEAVAATVDRFGRIDALLVNAGIYDWSDKPLWETPEAAWADQIGVCLEGAWRTARSVAPVMVEQQSGAIVFTSSNVGVEGAPCSAPYVAAKHGVIGLMRVAALELGNHNVRVNALLPSTTDTLINDHPAGWRRASGKPDGTREDYLDAVHQWTAMRNVGVLPARAAALAAIWLCSDDAAFVHGVQLPVDAGHLVLPGMNPWPVRDA